MFREIFRRVVIVSNIALWKSYEKYS